MDRQLEACLAAERIINAIQSAGLIYQIQTLSFSALGRAFQTVYSMLMERRVLCFGTKITAIM